MLTLITGLPGAGKTLRTIALIRDQATKENRQVFYHGIPELTLPWVEHDPTKWYELPPNSIMVIDECQRVFRNRSLGATPPKHVTELETHRHLGIDLFFLTQHPSLIDPAVRRLSGRHMHLVRLFGTQASTVHLWDSVKDNCDKSRAGSEKTRWVFDKSIYSLYKSAEAHTMKARVPLRAKLLLLVPVAVVCAVFAVRHMMLKNVPPPDARPASYLVDPASPGRSASVPSGAPARGAAPAHKIVDPVEDTREYIRENTPRIAGLPHTSPKYDQLTTPTHVPVPAMCVSAEHSGCRCYTQQATPMDVSDSMCKEFAKYGFFQDFDTDKDKRENERMAAGVRTLDGRVRDHPISPDRAIASTSGG
jgi:hypothetical protein